MNAAVVSVVYFVSGLIGSAIKAAGSHDQQTFSSKSLADLVLGGITGILVPLVMPSLIPTNANIVQQGAVVAVIAYTGSDIIQNFLGKAGVTLPGVKPMLMWLALPFGLLLPATAEAQPAPNVITRTDVTVGNVAATLCPVNGSRIDCSCTNNDAANAVRVGDANVNPTRGQRVSGGGTFKAATTGAVLGISEAGPNVVMSCTDQSR